jgi:hypothetical protein
MIKHRYNSTYRTFLVSLEADQREHSQCNMSKVVTWTHTAFHYLQNVTNLSFHTTWNSLQLQRTPQRALNIFAVAENYTAYSENSHCWGEFHTTCWKLHNCGNFSNRYIKLCRCIVLQMSTRVYWACILIGVVGVCSSVGVATDYGLDGLGIESRWGRDFSRTSRPALGPTQPPVEWVPGLSWARAWCWPLVPRSRKGRAIPLSTLWACSDL